MNGAPTVFLSYTWSDLVAVRRVERALRDRGIAVFRDVDTPTFDRITDGLADAESTVPRSCSPSYSTRYPTRYACQWELTRAFLAARRLGDPADRVLVVNPERDESHIAPVELTDAGYLQWGERPDVTGLVDRVAAKLAATGGIPLGTPAKPDDLARLDPRCWRRAGSSAGTASCGRCTARCTAACCRRARRCRTSCTSHTNSAHVEAMEQRHEPARPLREVEVHRVDAVVGEIGGVPLERRLDALPPLRVHELDVGCLLPQLPEELRARMAQPDPAGGTVPGAGGPARRSARRHRGP